MTEEYGIPLNYSSFSTQFNATSIHSHPILLSDIFEVKIDFAWTSPDLAKGNAAFLKIKYFLEEGLHQCILTHKDAAMELRHLDNPVVLFPFVPTNDIIAATLHAKLNTIAEDAIEVLTVTVTNVNTQPIMGYTYGDNEYPMLPTLKEFIGLEANEYFYETPWWFRNSPETNEHEVLEDSDLTTPPEYDTVLEEIEKLVLGELELTDEGGTVVDINGWKPKIV